MMLKSKRRKTTPCPCCGYVAATPSPPPSEPPSKKPRLSESMSALNKTKKRVWFADPIATYLGPIDAFDAPIAVDIEIGDRSNGAGGSNATIGSGNVAIGSVNRVLFFVFLDYENRCFMLGGSDKARTRRCLVGHS
ncbi:hypothetical protein FNV43_RR00200 [Rhamnella rubrinervis]|uniref:Uncharacterized protein n=1 Tax=Rhamnella rubrinervis TaxID=2594499 RepID=A0A8K0HMF9_9ROSA|nr:hypothetical protein FNV43_RR00200 [Rhamnella rubrinervis]